MVARENFATNVTSSISALDGRINEMPAYVKTIAVAGTTLSITSGAGDTTTFQTQDTTYDNATTTEAALMSAADKAKLDGLASNIYMLLTASTSTKGGVKIGNGLAMNGDTLNVTISGGSGENSNEFTERVTFNGGIYSRSTENNLSRSTINASFASITGNPTLSGEVTFTEPIYIDNITSTSTTKKGALWYGFYLRSRASVAKFNGRLENGDNRLTRRLESLRRPNSCS